MPQTLVLEDVISSAMDVALQGVWTALPAVVQSYDSSLQRANVQLAVKVASTGESGTRDTTTVAVINAVPIVHAGGGKFREVYPITVGDAVLVVFASRSIDTWLNHGGVVDPHFDHHHDISDAIAIAGLRDFAHPLKNVPIDHASIGHDEGATIEFHQNEIRLGSDGASSAVVVQSALDTFMTALGNAITTLGASPAGPALTVLRSELLLIDPTGWKAGTTKVKAE